jgi:hypothetical protein
LFQVKKDADGRDGFRVGRQGGYKDDNPQQHFVAQLTT